MRAQRPMRRRRRARRLIERRSLYDLAALALHDGADLAGDLARLADAAV